MQYHSVSKYKKLNRQFGSLPHYILRHYSDEHNMVLSTFNSGISHIKSMQEVILYGFSLHFQLHNVILSFAMALPAYFFIVAIEHVKINLERVQKSFCQRDIFYRGVKSVCMFVFIVLYRTLFFFCKKHLVPSC